MIYDRIENIDRYTNELGFIKKIIGKEFVSGKFDIDGEKCFGIGLEYETKDSSDAVWEAHRTYLDIHCVIYGEELVEISEIQSMKKITKYQEDFQLFEGHPNQSLVLRPGWFLMLFPNEVHKTSVKIKHSQQIRKIVFKLAFNGKEESPGDN